MGENKNLILAALLSVLVLGGWQYFIAGPKLKAQRIEREQAAAETAAAGPATPAAPGQAPAQTAEQAPEVAPMSREEALAQTARVPIRAPDLTGSISLRGGRIDDLHLTTYRETLKPDSDTVTLLSPIGSPAPYYSVYGWTAVGGAQIATPDANTEWTLESGSALSPRSPVTLMWDNGAGLTFHRTIAVDDAYMFTVTQSVSNATDAPVSLAPYGIIARHGTPKTLGFYILHEGAIGVFDGILKEIKYKDLAGLDPIAAEGGPAEKVSVEKNGWIGFTGKYWLTALAPESGASFESVFKATKSATGEVYQTDMRLPAQTAPAGGEVSVSTHLFAGAKEVSTLRAYEADLNIDKLDNAVDWGWFFFITKPLFWLLNAIKALVGNMGVSIILLTFVVKATLFPLAYKSYVSMSKMKMLQPKMQELKERAGDDKQRLQKEMMELYKREKVNPAAGCLPILMQIPIFFSLYKVLFVTIEMRQAPFFGWIQDLSAPDPTTVLNLFGLIDWTPPSSLHVISIGVFPILMGITMWLQQKLNPTPADQTQARIFGLMPILFTFMLGRFASGLVIYWCANNILTFTQQYTIMRSQGVDVDVFGNVKKSFKRKRKSKSS